MSSEERQIVHPTSYHVLYSIRKLDVVSSVNVTNIPTQLPADHTEPSVCMANRASVQARVCRCQGSPHPALNILTKVTFPAPRPAARTFPTCSPTSVLQGRVGARSNSAWKSCSSRLIQRSMPYHDRDGKRDGYEMLKSSAPCSCILRLRGSNESQGYRRIHARRVLPTSPAYASSLTSLFTSGGSSLALFSIAWPCA